jgi:hexosaminidase
MPEQVRYGTGRLPIAALTIRFASAPSRGDRFAADELAAILQKSSGAGIQVADVRSGPRRFIVLNRTAAGADLPGAGEKAGPESREAYSLSVRPDGCEIRAGSAAGLFYGVQTLRQLIEGSGRDASIPEVEIRDWPALAYRAVMMDMSHGALPTEEEVKRQIDFVARWKGNQYFFYSEGSIELKGYPLLNPDGRFTQDQVRRIVAYARERHIDVVPCLEFFGHLHDLFRIEHYSDLAVLPHGQDLNAEDPRVLPLLQDWAGQLSALFPSPFMHIGFDEPYELGKASERASGRSEGVLFLQHLKSVADIVAKLGKRVVIWGDMNVLRKNPEVLQQLPPGITTVPWHNGVMDDYGPYLGPFAERNIPAYASTSVYGYYQVFPDFNRTFAALANLIRDSKKYRAVGLLLTLWTDDAQNMTRMALPGIAYGLAGSWQSAPLAAGDFFADFARQSYGPAIADEVARALQACADAETRLQSAVGEYSMQKYWSDPLAASNLALAEAHREDFRQVRLLAEDAREHLHRAVALGAEPGSLAVYELGARMLDYAGMRYVYAAEMSSFWKQMGDRPSRRDLAFYIETEINDAAHSRIADLIDAGSALYEPYRTAWLAEYTAYRLRSALLKWDTETQYWWKVQRQLQLLLETFRDGAPLPPLTSFAK